MEVRFEIDMEGMDNLKGIMSAIISGDSSPYFNLSPSGSTSTLTINDVSGQELINICESIIVRVKADLKARDNANN